GRAGSTPGSLDTVRGHGGPQLPRGVPAGRAGKGSGAGTPFPRGCFPCRRGAWGAPMVEPDGPRPARLGGVVPVVPTPFLDDGALDLDGQRRVLDFLLDAGCHGMCLLANWSEQFSLSAAERARLTELPRGHVAGGVPVVVTTSHYSTRIV